MIEIDGSMGEGGGQIVRTTLALSVLEQQPVRLTRTRAGRDPSGLRPQHKTAVEGAASVGGATVSGTSVGSPTLTFEPTDVQPGTYHFDVGTAGSAVLVLQTVLPPLLTARQPSQVTVVGGTHVRSALRVSEEDLFAADRTHGPRVPRCAGPRWVLPSRRRSVHD